ncbi:MAG: hypothetical protein ACYC67_27010 [Prosthecobacter sp.]
MPDDPPNEWPEHELHYVQSELAKEYANVSITRISMVVDFTKAVISPAEGRVKLLAAARKNLSR